MKRFAQVLVALSLTTGAAAAITHVDPITESVGTHSASAHHRVDPITESVQAAHLGKVDPITE